LPLEHEKHVRVLHFSMKNWFQLLLFSCDQEVEYLQTIL